MWIRGCLQSEGSSIFRMIFGRFTIHFRGLYSASTSNAPNINKEKQDMHDRKAA